MIARSKPMRRSRPNVVPDSIREAVFVRAGWCCERCNQRKPLTYHHRLKRSQGGKHTVENGVALCQECHEHIEREPAEAVREGWTIQAGKVAL